jgi:hypothetical protein
MFDAPSGQYVWACSSQAGDKIMYSLTWRSLIDLLYPTVTPV